MNHYRHSGVDDTDSLQADVMRFMAIIAFCLIAILALVQKLDRPPSATQTDPLSCHTRKSKRWKLDRPRQHMHLPPRLKKQHPRL